MSKLNVFVSSTCYDLSQVRADLCDFIISLGHNPIISEAVDFPINPQISTMENCINAVRDKADILVLIIGNRYGALLDSGKSITNTEFLTALQKGIPVYTFTYKPLVSYLPIWERNPEADYSSVVENVKVFEFLLDVRQNKKLWNFEFERAQDIIDTLRYQLSYSFKDALALKRKITNYDIDTLYSKVSPKALAILIQKEEYYEMRFFLQSIIDELDKHSDLRNDYEYSLRLQPLEFRISELLQLIEWVQLKLGQMQNYISTLNNLFDAYRQFYGEPGVPSDINGLAYVARSFANLYSRILAWGIEVRSLVVTDNFKSLLSAFSEIPINVIGELEEFPRKALNQITEMEAKLHSGELAPGSTVTLPLSITIDQEVMSRFNREMEVLSISCTHARM